MINIIPLFPEQEIQLGGQWVTKKQLQNAIKFLFPDLVERSRIHSTFNTVTGQIDRKYAWNAVYNDINRAGLADEVISTLVSDKELSHPF